ncbi:MAG: hypothetical protein SPK23_02225 [Eubacteriales bacterium]|nr:hypothetical protein [Clostridiales bacterium]MDY5835931.1 hypothetical protein [Eubacteriales bacterium]
MKSSYPPRTHVKTRTRALMGWALVLALLITILTPGLGVTVQAEGTILYYHHVIDGEIYPAFTSGCFTIARGQTLSIQYQVTELNNEYQDTGVPVSGLTVRLVDANNDSIDIETQTTDSNGMVTFMKTEDEIKAICHREPSSYGTKYLPQTSYYDYLHTDDGGYNQKITRYRISFQNDWQTISDKTYRAQILVAPCVGFTFKDTKVCKLELNPLTLDYGTTFNPLDLIDRVGTDMKGVLKDVDVKQPDTDAKTLFTYQNEAGETVDTIDTTKPGVYKVTVQVFPLGNDENNNWCWDTQTTTVTVKDIPYIEIPIYPTPNIVETEVESIKPTPSITQPTVVTSAAPNLSVYDLPATGSVDAGLTIWMSLGLALAGLWLKKRG